jgi:hypothetical protein
MEINTELFQLLEPGKNLENDWCSFPIPLNIEVGENTVIDSSSCFKKFFSKLPVGLKLGSHITLQSPALATEENTSGLRELLPHLSNLHVFQWNNKERRPLEEGEAAWREYLALAQGSANWALLEFVENDEPENFKRDAETLKSLLDGQNPAA